MDSSYLICKEVFCKMSPHVVPCRPMSCCVAQVHVISLSWRKNYSTRSRKDRNLCIYPQIIVNDSRWQSMTACGSAVCMISLSWESAITWPLLRDQNMTNVGTPWHLLAPIGTLWRPRKYGIVIIGKPRRGNHVDDPSFKRGH